MNKRIKNIVFFGDSLTAGVFSDTYEVRTRKTYANNICKFFEDQGYDVNAINFAVSGYQSAEILNLLETDISYNTNAVENAMQSISYRKAIRAGYEHTIQLRDEDITILQAMKNADLIIFTGGGNDTLYYNYHHHFVGDKVDGPVFKNLKLQIHANILKIISKIRKVNKNAPIFHIGFYLPSSNKIISKYLYDDLIDFNQQLIDSFQKMSPAKVYYIPIYVYFKQFSKQIIDNNFDIHPNEFGYKYISEQFEIYYQMTTDDFQEGNLKI